MIGHITITQRADNPWHNVTR